MSSDLAAVLLLLGNAFFVAAEFSLVSARRDRLEAMAHAGTAGASTVLKASADLSRMLAASQLGITICSLLLGRLGEPAVAHLIEAPFTWAGLSVAVLEPVAFAISEAVIGPSLSASSTLALFCPRGARAGALVREAAPAASRARGSGPPTGIRNGVKLSRTDSPAITPRARRSAMKSRCSS